MLIVDDEPLICWSLAETLGDRGDIVIKAGNAKAAICAVANASEPIDVVLLDYRLPDSNDLGLPEQLGADRQLRHPGRCRAVRPPAAGDPQAGGDLPAAGAGRGPARWRWHFRFPKGRLDQ